MFFLYCGNCCLTNINTIAYIYKNPSITLCLNSKRFHSIHKGIPFSNIAECNEQSQPSALNSFIWVERDLFGVKTKTRDLSKLPPLFSDPLNDLSLYHKFQAELILFSDESRPCCNYLLNNGQKLLSGVRIWEINVVQKGWFKQLLNFQPIQALLWQSLVKATYLLYWAVIVSLRMERFSLKQLLRAEAGTQPTVSASEASELILAIKDSTTIGYQHSARAELGDLGGPEDSKTKGFWAHSVMLLDAETERTLGLIDQHRWIRDNDQRGKKHKRKQRPYEEKESFKWQQSSENVERRLGEQMIKTISVCDREAEIFEYVLYKLQNN